MSKTERQLGRMDAKLDAILGRLGGMPTMNGVWVMIATVLAVLVCAAIIILSPAGAFADDWPTEAEMAPCLELPDGSIERKTCLAKTLAEDGEVVDHVDRWLRRITTSPMDDSVTVSLIMESSETVAGRFGEPDTATLFIRCLENRTSIYVVVNDQFLSDIQGYGKVEYRVDKTPAHSRSMTASTDNQALGLWGGSAAIPFIKEIAEGEKLLLRVTPYNESPVMMTFPIEGLSEALGPLREACHW